jgi:tetratricopeptide (TPR) repeat protein
MKKSDMSILAAGSESKADITKCLRELGYSKIHETEDALATWNHIKTADVEAIFSDWQLGQFDGLVLLKLMRADKKFSDIPVVLIAGQLNRDMIIDAGNAGVSGILLKPFDGKSVGEKIGYVFDIDDREKDREADGFMENGKALVSEGKYEEALSTFNQVIDHYENPEVYYNIGYIKASQQHYDESIIAFRRAITIDQKYAEAFEALGEVYLKIGFNDKSAEMMQRAGDIYLEKNMSKEAEIAFHEVLKLNPNSTNIYNSLGILYRRDQNFAKALQAYEKALKVDPEDENIFFNLGRACSDSGFLKRAKLYLEKALEIYPGFEEASLLLNKVKRKLK